MAEHRPYDAQESTIKSIYSTSTSTLVRNEEISMSEHPKIYKIDVVDYKPHEHRNVEHPNGFAGAFLHICKTSLGTGILAIPRAFKSAGLLVGLFGTVFVGIMCTHAIHMLVKASGKICQKTRTPSLGFAATAEGVFKIGPPRLRKYSKFAKYFVEAGLFSIHFLADSVYIVFISISLTTLISAYYPEINNWHDAYLKLALLVPLLICGQVRELKHLVPFSFVANLMLLVTFGTTGYYMFSGIEDISLKDRNLATGLSGIPSFFSTVLFSMEGIGTIMPVENSMVEPNFLGCPGVLNMAMGVVVSLYAAVGFFGYYKFGEDTKATITSNLPVGKIPSEVAQAAIAVAVFFSFMLVFYVPVDILWSYLKHRVPDKWKNAAQIGLRCQLILLATGIAIAGGENLGLLIDLVGAIFLSILGLFVPAALDIVADWDDDWGRFHWRLVKNVIFMIMAVFGMISGVFYAIKDAIA